MRVYKECYRDGEWEAWVELVFGHILKQLRIKYQEMLSAFANS
jgi:hypothetical protein